MKEAGFEPNQAEAVAKAIAHSGQELATKADITWLRWICGAILVIVGALTWQVFAIGQDVAALVATLTAGG